MPQKLYRQFICTSSFWLPSLPPLQLVASLERMLQQPAGATPGRTALTALRQSQAAELSGGPSFGSGGPVLSAAPSFSLGTGQGSRTLSATTDASGGISASTRAPDRWRLAADRAASFRAAHGTSTAGSLKLRSGSWRDAGPSPTASPAADLLAEIDRVTASPAATPAATPAASPAALPSLTHLVGSHPASALTHNTTAWQAQHVHQQQQQLVQDAQQHSRQQQHSEQQQHQEQHHQQQWQTPPASPEAEAAAASRWNALAASRPAALGGSPGSPASPLAAFGFAAHSPSPAGLPRSPGAAPVSVSNVAALASISAAGRVELPPQDIQLGLADSRCCRLGVGGGYTLGVWLLWRPCTMTKVAVLWMPRQQGPLHMRVAMQVRA